MENWFAILLFIFFVGVYVVNIVYCIIFNCYKRFFLKTNADVPPNVELPSDASLMEHSLDPSVECSICLSNKTDLILPCSHMFHAKCLEEWFYHNTTCPLCRYDCSILLNEV